MHCLSVSAILFERPTRFGLIAGDGEYPIIITKEAIKNGSEIIGIGFTDITSPQLAELIPNFIWTPFGKIEPIVNAFMTHNINKAIFAGENPPISHFQDRPFRPAGEKHARETPHPAGGFTHRGGDESLWHVRSRFPRCPDLHGRPFSPPGSDDRVSAG